MTSSTYAFRRLLRTFLFASGKMRHTNLHFDVDSGIDVIGVTSPVTSGHGFPSRMRCTIEMSGDRNSLRRTCSRLFCKFRTRSDTRPWKVSRSSVARRLPLRSSSTRLRRSVNQLRHYAPVYLTHLYIVTQIWVACVYNAVYCALAGRNALDINTQRANEEQTLSLFIAAQSGVGYGSA